MNSAEALIKSIQGLSATPGDLSALHGILKKAEDSLRNNWDVQLATLEELDPSIHSLGYLYLLEGLTRGSVSKGKTSGVLLLMARFINRCDAGQIRLASEKFVTLCKRFKDRVLELEDPLRGVAPLVSAVLKVQVSAKCLTALHPDCLQLCLQAKSYKAGFSVLSDDILEVDQPRDFYLYCYYGGMICIGLKRFQKASELLYNVVTAPMYQLNAIALEAYKKYILVNLIHSGQFSNSVPKCASTAAQRHLKSWCIPYNEVGNRYNDGEISELEAVVVAHSSDFEQDNNLGLVRQAVASLYKRNILRLTQKYLTLSLQDIANMVQLANAKEAETHVLQMIQDGQIHALINQKDGMVRFLEDPEQYKTSDMIEVMDSVIQRTIGLSKNLIAMDESLSCDPLYLGKVGRERQKFDFGDDFDTVPQKFSMVSSLSQLRNRNSLSSSRFVPQRSLCVSSSSSDTLLAGGSPKENERQSKVSSKKEGDDAGDLKHWLDKNGLPPCKVLLKERPAHDQNHKPIHYVAASEDLQKGDVAFSVPDSLVVTLERVLGNETIAELLTTNKLSELACLALYLMYEKKQGKKSVWYPYIRELDRQRGRGQLDVESPLLWSEAELEYLTGSPTKAEVLERAEGIKREYSELDTVWFMAGSLFQQYPFDIPTEAFTFEIFKQAFAAVQSCVVHLQNVSLARRFALVPLGPPLLAYCSNCKAMLTAVDGAVQLVVDRPYKAGDPIVVWCGPQPNAKLLLNYGFIDEDNPYDRIIVEAALSTDDPQYQDKRLVAQRNGKLSQQVFQVRVGKEKEAVQDMLPYLRLGYMSDPAEMQSVISSQGPVCSMSPCMERAVLDQLADYFMRRLAGYPTTLKEDDALLADPSLNPRKRVATRLVRLEKKMLAACLVATVDLLNELPDTTISPCPAPYAPSLK
ncbi:unnamed protein product [Brassica napus]|uniref:COP9 signalosome complex subunit 3 n=1 Tax=Brassica napus TaxID=3708 RepID=A0A817BD36_BRANA|nr:unnamed protein product [Brassica napus]